LKTIPRKLPWLAAALLLVLAGVYLLRWSAHPRLESLGLLALALVAFVIYWTVQKSQQRIRELGHLETRRLLQLQEETNRQLLQANQRLLAACRT